MDAVVGDRLEGCLLRFLVISNPLKGLKDLFTIRAACLTKGHKCSSKLPGSLLIFETVEWDNHGYTHQLVFLHVSPQSIIGCFDQGMNALMVCGELKCAGLWGSLA